MTQKAHLYICGSLKMAAGVTEKLKCIFMKEGNLTKEAAEKHIKDLKVRKVLPRIFKTIILFLKKENLQIHQDIYYLTSSIS